MTQSSQDAAAQQQGYFQEQVKGMLGCMQKSIELTKAHATASPAGASPAVDPLAPAPKPALKLSEQIQLYKNIGAKLEFDGDGDILDFFREFERRTVQAHLQEEAKCTMLIQALSGVAKDHVVYVLTPAEQSSYEALKKSLMDVFYR